MKIRIKGNSIRYRLTKTEVEVFSREGYYSEETTFNGNTLVYALKAIYGVSNLMADFENNKIIMCLPIADCKSWAGNNQVGFKYEMPLENGEILSLLLEKDFVCLDERGEDESDNYPNPKAT
jgi:hypothetical protein